MYTKLSTILFILALLPTWLAAQLSEQGTPPSSLFQLEKKAPTMTMPDVDVPALLEEDEEDLASNLPLRFAQGFDVDYNLNNSGVWDTLRNGDRIWRLTIACPGAMNINFLYSDFYLPTGAELYVYNSDKTQVLGAFTYRNNKETRRFATALIHDEVATLEYHLPAKVNETGSIQIAQVAHGYRGLDGQTASEKAGPCQVNINCPEGDNWQHEKKGVAKILMDGLYLCSGTLLNNSAYDCKPYFSTANHCIDGGIKQDAIINPDVSGYIFYWNFEYPGCAESGPLPDQTTNGGTVVASAGTTGQHTILSSDFALILLAENPRDQYDVFFNGFDASGDQGQGGVGIHHPAGDDKKISTHSTVPEDGGYFWELYWDATPNGHSVTEGGSSGSPLFRENHLVLGQLFGGGSVNCDDPANDLAMYGKYSYSWTNEDELLSSDPRRRLHDWLDPIAGGEMKVVYGEYDPCESARVYFAGTSTSAAEADANVNNGCQDYRDYTIDLKITPYPTQPVIANIMVGGTAQFGSEADYNVFPTSVTFNNVTNTRTITIRVYDDSSVENPESIVLNMQVTGTNGYSAIPLYGLHQHTVTIADNDTAPTSHVQSVRNSNYPAVEYLGPYSTVYFTDPGSGGVMMRIDNTSSHNYGCTSVFVDNAGAGAVNSWSSGSTANKTFQVVPQFNNPSGAFRITLYYTASEINGWEWFNAQGSDRTALQIHKFPGEAIPANEGQGVTTITEMDSYGSDFTFSGNFFSGMGGFTIGNLGLSSDYPGGSLAAPGGSGLDQAQEQVNMHLSPNPTTTNMKVEWQSEDILEGELQVMDSYGKVLFSQPVSSQGYHYEMINTSNLSAGVYFLQILTENGQINTKRFVKLN